MSCFLLEQWLKKCHNMIDYPAKFSVCKERAIYRYVKVLIGEKNGFDC